MHRLPSFQTLALGRPQALGLAVARVCLACSLWGGVGLATAADAPAPAAALVPGRSYVVMPGDTLDRVVQKTMTGSPLKNEVLREALVAANPQLLPAGKKPRLVSGTVLQVPDPEAVLRNLVSPLTAAAEPASASGPGEPRRRWVRFP